MRIAIVTGEYPPMQGGVGAYTAILARELTAQGHEVFILTTPPAESGSTPGITVSATMAGWGLGQLAALRRRINEIQPDVVNLQFQTAAFRMSPFVHFVPELVAPVPVVTTFHDLRFPYLFPKAGPLRTWIVHRLARRSASAIVTNHEDAAQLAGLPHVRLIPIGSNILTDAPARAEQYRSQASADPVEALVVYFGLVNRSKGLETLLEAFRRLLDRGVRARLALVGAVAGDSDATNQAYLAEIDRLIAQHRLEPCIHRTGYLGERDVAGYLTAADVVALPFADGASYRRGSLMAALRLGCAIVTTTPAVEVTTFQDGENMMLIRPGDGQALADALHKVIADPALRTRLHAGSARLSSAFEWPQIAQATLAVFDRAIGSRA